MKAKADLRRRVLQSVKVLAIGQEPEPEDVALVDEMIDSAHAYLRTHGVATWTLDAIPDDVFAPLVQYVSGHAAVSFVGASEVVAYLALQRQGFDELASLTSERASAEPVEGVYF